MIISISNIVDDIYVLMVFNDSLKQHMYSTISIIFTYFKLIYYKNREN